MKNCFVSLLFFLSIGSNFIKGQENVVFREDFNDNTNEWSVGDRAKIKKGSYNLYLPSHYSSFYDWSYYSNLSPRGNFQIETKLRHAERGNEKAEFGLVLIDMRNSKNRTYYQFLISGEQKAIINQQKEKEEKATSFLKGKKFKKLIRPYGQFNKLKIKQEGNLTSFYINDIEIFRKKNLDFRGQYVGVILYKDASIEIDYLEITKEKRKINLVKNAEQGYKKNKLGTAINSGYSELLPIVSHDGNTLYFCRGSHPANIGKGEDQDIWVASRLMNTDWSIAKNIGKPLNNKNTNGVISVAPDGNTLLIMGQYKKDGSFKADGISISHKSKKGWKVPLDINIDDYFNRNRRAVYCLSPNNKVLISSVERPDSHGDLDLYVSFLKDSLTFSKPVNMGGVINTFGSETTPFIAADGKTMYFSSNGHPGYGKNDIFLSHRLDDTWTNWSKPENLGPEINTRKWDAYYTIPASGEKAYMVVAKDIYSVGVPEEAKPEPVVLVYGKVLNKETKAPLGAKITYSNLKSNSEAGIANSNPGDGSYKIILPYGVNYGFSANKEKFFPISQNLDLTKIEKYTEIERDLYLSPLKVGEAIRLNNIFFDYNKSTLLPESYVELDQLFRLLNTKPKINIEIGGHTDNKGTESYNMTLSKNRVGAVVKYLLKKGIAQKRVIAKAYGETKPIADNSTAEGREINRRVEFKVLSD